MNVQKRKLKLTGKQATVVHVAGAFVSIMLLIGTIFAASCLVAFSKWFYNWQQASYDLATKTGVSLEDFNVIVRAIIDYLSGKAAQLAAPATVGGVFYDNFFSERTLAHMDDVLKIFNVVKICALIMIPLAIAIFIATLLWLRGRPKAQLAKGMLTGMIVLLVILAGLVVWILVDFDGAFIAFHHLLFSNDLWQLSPSSDFLIRMLPQEVFFNAAIIIVSSALIALITIIVSMSLLHKHDKKKRLLNTVDCIDLIGDK